MKMLIAYLFINFSFVFSTNSFARHSLSAAISRLKLSADKETENREVNIYKNNGTYAAAFRTINTTVPTFESLGLPPIVRKITEKPISEQFVRLSLLTKTE